MSTIDPLSSATINADVIIEARWVATVAPHQQVLENHAVIIQAGVIAEILPIPEARKKYTASSIVCIDEHVNMFSKTKPI